MNKDYSKFLNAKLYVIETISRKYMKYSEEMAKIHEICIASPSKLDYIYEHMEDYHG